MSSCSDPHHHVKDPQSFLAAVDLACEQKGLRLTASRRKVLEALANADKPQKAYDLLEALKFSNESAAPPTVYRALEFLTEHGFVHRLESINCYVACHHPGGSAHATPFLICDRCGDAQELEQAAWISELEHDAKQLGFKVRDRVLELHGVCAKCAADTFDA